MKDNCEPSLVLIGLVAGALVGLVIAFAAWWLLTTKTFQW